MPKVAINGFGRIGRIFFRQAFTAPSEASATEGHEGIDIVAINDLGDVENLAYLLKYDTVYRAYHKSVEVHDGNLVVDGKEVRVLNEKDPSALPWGEMDIDVVVESTGVFETFEKAKPHLDAGAKRVVISAPAKDDITPTMTPNVGWDAVSHQPSAITSNASCTTNAISPVMAILVGTIGVKKAVLNTIHGYTATQSLVDSPTSAKASAGKPAKKQDFRRGRAAAMNIVPSSTGAAIATTRALPHLKDKFDGLAMRVPVVTGSIIDVTFVAEKPTTVEEVNGILKEYAQKEEWKDIIAVSEEQIVSSDIIGMPYGSIVDLALTRVIDGDLVKVCSWYDNEWGYCAMLIKHVEEVSKLL